MKATARELDSFLVSWLDEHRRKRSSGEGEGLRDDFMDVLLSITEDAQISNYDSDTIINAACLVWFL